MPPIRILLADDHGLVRQGLRAILEVEPGIEIIGEAEDGRVTINMVDQLAPDMVLMDISMPGLNGLEATRQIGARAATTAVIILSMHTDAEYMTQALRAGARGYVLKHGIKQELLQAIETVNRGDIFLTPSASRDLIDSLLASDDATNRLELLTPREREILQLIGEENTTRDIAARLSISPKTAERHRANIMQKLDIHSLAGLVRFSIQAGLINLDL